MASQSPPISQTLPTPLLSSSTAQSTSEAQSSSTPHASAQIFRLSGGSPLVTFSPYVASSVGGQAAGVSRGWLEQADASGHEMMQTFGEDVDGTWMMISNVSAQSFTPYFTVLSGGYDITAQVDSGVPVALTQSGTKLSATTGVSNHQFRMKVACKTGSTCSSGGAAAAFSFQGIDLESMSSTTAQNLPVNATIDDSSKVIDYQGFASTNAPPIGAQSIVNDAVVKSSKEKTLSYTATRGANATVYFTGSSLQITGVAGPSMGTFSVALDSETPMTIANATRGIFSVQQLLFFSSKLIQGEHQVTITNLEEGKGLALDSLSVSGSGLACFGKGCGAATQPTKPATTNTTSAPIQTGLPAQGAPLQTGLPGGKTNGGASAGSVIGGLLGALFAIVILLLLWRRWKKKQDKKDDKQKLNAWDEANMLTKQPNHFVRVEPKETMPYRSLGTARTHGRGPAGIAV